MTSPRSLVTRTTGCRLSSNAPKNLLGFFRYILNLYFYLCQWVVQHKDGDKSQEILVVSVVTPSLFIHRLCLSSTRPLFGCIFCKKKSSDPTVWEVRTCVPPVRLAGPRVSLRSLIWGCPVNAVDPQCSHRLALDRLMTMNTRWSASFWCSLLWQ